MKCEETRRFNLVRRPTLGGHFRGSRGGPTAKSARFRNKRGEMNIKRGHFWTKWPNLGEIRRKSKEIEEIPQFYHGKGNFLRTDGRTDGNISALRAGVPQISVHQNFDPVCGRASADRFRNPPGSHSNGASTLGCLKDPPCEGYTLRLPRP